jgi:FtsH-binding integral membrane protein
MLLRWQHAWLLLAATFSFLSFLFPFYHGSLINQNIVQPIEIFASSHPGTFILSVALTAGCLSVIFINKDLNIQWILTIGFLLISILNIMLYFKFINHIKSGTGALSLSAIFTFLIPICIFLAAKQIRRNEKDLKKSLASQALPV